MADQSLTTEKGWMQRFLPLWIGQLVSLLGSGLVQFALVWYLTQQTGSAVVLATATLVALIPDVFLGPFAGALVDRWNRKRVMIIADGSVALATLGLVILFWTGAIQVWHIYVALFIRSLGGIFHWPAMQASTSLMVPEGQLARLSGLNQAVRGALNIAAPPLGALLMTLVPMYGVLAVDIFTAAIAIGILIFITVPQPAGHTETEVTPKQLFKDVAAGARYMARWPGALQLVGMAALINFVLAPSGTLMPLLVTKELGGGVWHLGALDSAMGIGIVIGGLLLGLWGGFKRKVYTSLFGIVGIGVSVMVLASAPVSMFAIAVIGVVLMGMMGPIANGPLQAMMQAKVAPNMQGRVFTLISALCTAMMPLSMVVAAPVAEWLGVRSWYWLGGILTVLAGAICWMMPKIRAMEDWQDPEIVAGTSIQPSASPVAVPAAID